MSLDHGLLNLPFSKRGNFHKELDEHLVTENRKKQETFQVAKNNYQTLREQANAMFAELDYELIKLDAKRRGMRPASLKKVIREMCSDTPKKALIVMEAFLKKREEIKCE